jgi:hypothetical protein
MTNISHYSRVSAAMTLAGMLIATPAAMAQKPDATIYFGGGSAGLIVGANWGSGTLYYQGKKYPLKVSGLGVGTVGVSHFSATGEVYNLKTPKDIEGTYGAGSASATAVSGASVLDMTNGAGVQIKARSKTSGVQLTLAASGVKIKLK